ncbi:translation initiation factor EF-1 [Endozoicomonas montiporae]|uniref:Translation initiation factor EF-1 n=2 Tax=Endozoicomonas montiporae TaxID=1027273 RepID=A0A081N1Y7_9GAMM|nr:stress response translation initiation inhibitor YciH [Endozoicomonas montiporae]AMO58589.1 translation initiation factor Sui1 [Endozoicomonas montiporae CL-33]KEQ12460.1 translation initiation factor EF-1 [Endozoicomonas montiporae]
MSNSRLVYSTDVGRVKEEKPEQATIGDGNVRVRPEKKGRGGKTVTVISGLPLAGNDLKAFAKKLKKRAGGGGSVKDGNIELQGDHVDVMVDVLKKEGYDAKRSGG